MSDGLKDESARCQQLLQVLTSFLGPDELEQVISYHCSLSKGLGTPVGVIKLIKACPKQS
jgi:hypothetical protein